ncbi:MAG TPA: porin family protein [Chryseosolibacter sp.]
MNRKLVVSLTLFSIVGVQAIAQNCTQILRTARSTYEQGRLHEIPTILEGCLKGGDFSSAQKVEAYRILVLSYIYLEEPAKADETMIALLNEDHFFKPSATADPVEFHSLWKKFRTNPVFSYGIKVGLNTNNVDVQKNYYMFGPAQGEGEYKANLGFQFGLLFEKNLNSKVILNPELFYSGISLIYSNNNLSSTDPFDEQNKDNMEYTLSHSRIQLNVLFQYRFLKGKVNETFAPYISVGPSLYYTLSSTFAGDLTLSSQTTIPSLSTKENYRALGYGVVASAGVKYKVGGIYLTADIRHIYGLNNIVNEDNRFKRTAVNQALQDAGYIDNDFTLSQSMLNIGMIIPYFKPKKLIR